MGAMVDDVDAARWLLLQRGLDLPDMATLAGRPPAWHADAACRGQGTARWHPDRGQSAGPARAVCRDCPVRLECAVDAFSWDAPGVWGGLAERPRLQQRRARLKRLNERSAPVLYLSATGRARVAGRRLIKSAAGRERDAERANEAA